MLLKKLLSLIDLLKAQTFYIHKILEIVIIYKNKNFILIAFQILMLTLKYFNNNKKLAIVSFILYFL